MIDLKFTKHINKPIDQVWKIVIEEFSEAHKWATGTTSCRKGSPSDDFDRICKTETGVLMDKITNLDNDKFLLEFSVKGLPFFVRSVKSTWKLKKISDTKTEIILGPTIKVKPVIGTIMQFPMKMAFRKIYPGLLDDLAIYIETRMPSPRKQKEIDQRI